MKKLMFVLCFILYGAPARAQEAPQAPLLVKGRVLTVDAHYLVFTTGDAVRLANVNVVHGAPLALGETVLVRIDRATRTVIAVVPASGAPDKGAIDAAALPRDVVAVDPRSARSATASGVGGRGAATGTVTVRIDVAVPDVTPPGDDIYLSTDRTNFSSAELRMNRVDAFDWTVTLPLAAGTTLRYTFTRGSPASVERDSSGGIATPRTLIATAGAHEKDRVARWSDKY